MISKAFYKDRPAIKLSDDRAEFLFLPEDGAKLVSFKIKGGRELLAQNEGMEYKRLFLDSSYVNSECSAFDDMFPTIDPCTINGLDYIDHGQVCRIEHNYTIENDKVKFECRLSNLNVTYKKVASIENGTLNIKYTIVNHNDFDFPYIWAGHMMFAGEEGAKAESVFSSGTDIRVMFGHAPEKEKMHILEKYGASEAYKYYYTQAASPMKCGIMYSDLHLTVNFEGDAVKYFALWMNPGDFKGMYNIALEPCTAPYDSPEKAKEANAESVIKAGGIVEFTMKIGYEEK